MKVKTISRIEEDYTRECKSDILKVHRNLDPALHPMHRAKEYKRALNATKLDKVSSTPDVLARSRVARSRAAWPLRQYAPPPPPPPPAPPPPAPPL